jgi:hypothetical protein
MVSDEADHNANVKTTKLAARSSVEAVDARRGGMM